MEMSAGLEDLKILMTQQEPRATQAPAGLPTQHLEEVIKLRRERFFAGHLVCKASHCFQGT